MEEITLRPYQKRILKELNDRKGIGLFMSTGSGKTFTILSRVKYWKIQKNIVICPHTIVEQWKDATLEIFPDARFLEFKKSWTAKRKARAIKETPLSDYDYLIFNFEIADSLKEVIRQKFARTPYKFQIIVDESHRMKSLGTEKKPVKTTHAILSLADLTPYKAILTATPTEGNWGGYIDYYTQLKFIDAIDMDFNTFKERHCIEKKINVSHVPFPVPILKGYKKTWEIDNVIKKHCRRYKPSSKEVKEEHIKITVPKSPRYDKMIENQKYKGISLKGVGARGRIAKKTMATGVVLGKGEGKDGQRFEIPDNTSKIDWLENFLKDTDEPVVIFYQYNVELASLLKMVEKIKKKHIVVNGKAKDKYSLVNKTKWDVMLGQYQAASESIDGIHKKSHIVVYFGMPESSKSYIQSKGRISRDGQKYTPLYYYLVMDGTVDFEIFKLIKEKKDFNDKILDKISI